MPEQVTETLKQDAENLDAATKVETEDIDTGLDAKNAGSKKFSPAEQDAIDAAVEAKIQGRLAKHERSLQKAFDAEKAQLLAEKDLNENERLKAENARLKARESERTLTTSLDAAFEKAGVSDIPTRKLLVGNYKNEAKVNDNGEYENLLDIVQTAKEDFPDSFVKKAKGSADAAAKGGEVITDEEEFAQSIRAAFGY